jgi:hypothetical protein
LAAAAIGLAAHITLYRSLWPHDGVHAYLIWYEPFVAGLSLGVAMLLPVLLAVALLARRSGRQLRWLSGVASRRHEPFGVSVSLFAAAGLGFLFLQETLERSIAAHALTAAAFTPGATLWLLLGAFSAALVLVLLIRAGESVIRAVLREGAAPRRGSTTAWSLCPAVRRSARPLAINSALRAPPRLSTV